MLGMFNADVFYSKIVDNECERDWPSFVLPEPWNELALVGGCTPDFSPFSHGLSVYPSLFGYPHGYLLFTAISPLNAFNSAKSVSIRMALVLMF